MGERDRIKGWTFVRERDGAFFLVCGESEFSTSREAAEAWWAVAGHEPVRCTLDLVFDYAEADPLTIESVRVTLPGEVKRITTQTVVRRG